MIGLFCLTVDVVYDDGKADKQSQFSSLPHSLLPPLISSPFPLYTSKKERRGRRGVEDRK
uniref:Uncharacterized protein n=1 Tax=Anguilla anguilla TaxID=7936 RepID=A0A0E9VXJ3_ANGAN